MNKDFWIGIALGCVVWGGLICVLAGGFAAFWKWWNSRARKRRQRAIEIAELQRKMKVAKDAQNIAALVSVECQRACEPFTRSGKVTWNAFTRKAIEKACTKRVRALYQRINWNGSLPRIEACYDEEKKLVYAVLHGAKPGGGNGQ